MQILDIICINKEDYIITGQKNINYWKYGSVHQKHNPNFIMREFKRGCEEGCLSLSIRE